MAKRVDSGDEKRTKKPLIRSRRRRRRHNGTLLKKLVDYLKSDSYMFAPLLSHYTPPDFVASNAVVSSPAAGVELKEKSIGEVQKVGNYLKSDSYLYAPLFAPQHILSSKEQKGGNGEHIAKRVSMELSSKKLVMEGKEGSIEKLEYNEGDERRRRKILVSRQHKETVEKHIVCRTSSPSWKWIDRRLRKWLIE